MKLQEERKEIQLDAGKILNHTEIYFFRIILTTLIAIMYLMQKLDYCDLYIYI